MNVYVAGRTTDIERVNRVQDLLRRVGHTISFDWTEDPASGIRGDWSDDVPAAFERSVTERDAIAKSDALVLCWLDGMCGALFETGIAMAYGHRIVVLDAGRESVFFYLPNVVRVNKEWQIAPALQVTPVEADSLAQRLAQARDLLDVGEPTVGRRVNDSLNELVSRIHKARRLLDQ